MFASDHAIGTTCTIDSLIGRSIDVMTAVARGFSQAAPLIGFVAATAGTSLAALSTVAVLYTGVLGSLVGVAVRDAFSRPSLL